MSCWPSEDSPAGAKSRIRLDSQSLSTPGTVHNTGEEGGSPGRSVQFTRHKGKHRAEGAPYLVLRLKTLESTPGCLLLFHKPPLPGVRRALVSPYGQEAIMRQLNPRLLRSEDHLVDRDTPPQTGDRPRRLYARLPADHPLWTLPPTALPQTTAGNSV